MPERPYCYGAADCGRSRDQPIQMLHESVATPPPFFGPVYPNGRGGGFKRRKVWVRIPPQAHEVRLFHVSPFGSLAWNTTLPIVLRRHQTTSAPRVAVPVPGFGVVAVAPHQMYCRRPHVAGVVSETPRTRRPSTSETHLHSLLRREAPLRTRNHEPPNDPTVRRHRRCLDRGAGEPETVVEQTRNA